MMSSRILLVYLKNLDIKPHNKMVDSFLNEPMKFLMTSLLTNQNTLYRIIWRRSLSLDDHILPISTMMSLIWSTTNLREIPKIITKNAPVVNMEAFLRKIGLGWGR